VYGFNAATGEETQPYLNNVITVMAVDNLPNELPRDASEDFGIMFSKYVVPELLKEQHEQKGESSTMLDLATIAQDGKLTSHFTYLQNYVDGLE